MMLRKLLFNESNLTFSNSNMVHAESRTTRITLDGLLRGKLQSCLKLRNFQNPFNKDKSVGL